MTTVGMVEGIISMSNVPNFGGKRFSPQLYEKNDPAKDLIIKWLINNGHMAMINPDQYGIDVITEENGDIQYYEVEVKHNWTGSAFPYQEVHIPYRKMKFAKKNSFFAVFNENRTHFIRIAGYLLSEAKIITKRTIYTQNEQFIEIPISQCEIITLEQNVKV